MSSMYLESVAGTATIASAIGIVLAIIKCCERKKLKTSSGCISCEMEADAAVIEVPQPKPSPALSVVEAPRTPLPSLDITKDTK